MKEGDPVGKHVILVDDMIQSGGTLLECGKVRNLAPSSPHTADAESFLVSEG